MKRIISAVAVIAIVSSSLAFKAKPLSGAYCGEVIGTNGCRIIPQLRELTGAATHHIKADWNGTAADCTNVCPTQIHLEAQP